MVRLLSGITTRLGWPCLPWDLTHPLSLALLLHGQPSGLTRYLQQVSPEFARSTFYSVSVFAFATISERSPLRQSWDFVLTR